MPVVIAERDAQLINYLRNRDHLGCKMLMEQYAPAIYGVIARITGNNKQAEEVLEHWMLGICEEINHFEEKRVSFFTWLLNSAREVALKYVHKNNSAKSVSAASPSILELVLYQGLTIASTAKMLNLSVAETAAEFRRELNLKKQHHTS